MAKAYELCWINEAFEDRGLDTLPVVLADTGYLAEALSARGSRCGDIVGDEDIHLLLGSLGIRGAHLNPLVGDEDIHLLLRSLGIRGAHLNPLVGDEDIHLQLKPLGRQDTHPSLLVGAELGGALGYTGAGLGASSP